MTPRRSGVSVGGVEQETFTITLDLPSAELSQNKARVGHWSKKSRAVKAARETAALEASFLLASQSRFVPWTRARISGRFYYPDKRRRDLLNSIGSLKAYIDGIVDAGVLADDSGIVEVGKFGFEIDAESPRVVIHLERSE